MDTNLVNKKLWGGGAQPWSIDPRDLLRHAYILGQTGTGKSTILQRLVTKHIQEGAGVALIDPHGDTADACIDAIPRHRTDDLIYFNPAGDTDRPVSINLLDSIHPDAHHLVASGIVEAFRNLYAESWGPRLEWILYNGLRALLDYPNSTILGVPRILTDSAYRARVVRRITDPAIRSFWIDEFAKYTPRFRTEAISPILNKVGQLRANPILRNVLGQPRRSVDLRDVMDTSKIFIANLSKGELGATASNILGSLLVTWFQASAMSRASIPEAERVPFHLIIDEFHNLTTTSFASALSEARKFGLSLTLANQYLGQMSPETREAVFGNVATVIAFRCGADDAEVLEKTFNHEYRAHQFTDLAPFQVFIKTIVEGELEVLKASTIAPATYTHRRRDNLIDVSRRKYGRPRAAVEEEVRRQIT